METTEMIQLANYTGVIVCNILAVYFLRIVKRVYLWWAAGFSLFGLGVLATIAAVLGFHIIYVIIAFVCVAAAVAFLYYAASLVFFDKKSFFRERFTVILFMITFVLFVLPVYLLPEEHTAKIVGSLAMVLFAAAFLVLAVLFHHVARRIHEINICRSLGALQCLAWWIIAVWSLSVALLWGSVMVVGLVFVLGSSAFMVLLYRCRGGGNMPDEDEERTELYIQMIDSIEDNVKREAAAALERLNDNMREIGRTLLVLRLEDEKDPIKKKVEALAPEMGIIDGNQITSLVTLLEKIYEEDLGEEKIRAFISECGIKDTNLVGKSLQLAEKILGPEKDFLKRKMVIRASEIGMKEEKLMECVVELVKNTFELVKNTLIPAKHGPIYAHPDEGNPGGIHDKIPLAEAANQSNETNQSSGEYAIRVLAMLARTRSSTDRDMVVNCCNLVVDICNLEKNALTKCKWKGLNEFTHPRGMIGCTYNILYAIDKKTKKTWSQKFRDCFEGKADELLQQAETLWRDANCLIDALQEPPCTPSWDQAKKAAGCLRGVAVLLQDASELIKNASEFVKDPEAYMCPQEHPSLS